MAHNHQRMFWYFYVNQNNASFYLQNSDLLVQLDHEPPKIFTGNTDNKRCNTWSLEATTIPRCVNIQHIMGIANILADSISRLKAVGLYHDLDLHHNQPDLSTPFEPLPSHSTGNSHPNSSRRKSLQIQCRNPNRTVYSCQNR